MKVYAEFDQAGICRRIIRCSDESMDIDATFEEIIDEELKETIMVNSFHKVNGVIAKMSDTAIDALHNDIFGARASVASV